MATFIYFARDRSGDLREGRLKAESAEAAGAEIRAMGLEPLWIWPAGLRTGQRVRGYKHPTWKLARDDGMVLEYAVSSAKYVIGLVIWLIGAAAVALIVTCFPLLGADLLVPIIVMGGLLFLVGAAVMLIKGTLTADRVTGRLSQSIRLGRFTWDKKAVDMRRAVEVIVTGREKVLKPTDDADSPFRLYEVRVRQKGGTVVEVDSSSSAAIQYQMGRKLAECFDLPLRIEQDRTVPADGTGGRPRG